MKSLDHDRALVSHHVVSGGGTWGPSLDGEAQD